MKRPFLLVAGAAAAGLLIAGIGASAHTFIPAGFTGVHSATFGDEATGARTESPEPAESPEAAPRAEPTEKPVAPRTAKPAERREPADTETDGQSGSGEHDGGGGGHGGGGD